ncbi:MAG: hypothetical protein IKP92_08700 [Lachnospiraceae bacterium]|nr:hypothetical protein [Lachnospiraceae bacterium]
MELNEIANRGKLVNIIIIAANFLTFFVYLIGRRSDSETIIAIQTVIRVLAGVAAVGGIVYTAILMKENEKRLKGLGPLLAASITTLCFSILGCMIGIVIWILCGISMKQLESSFKEQSTMNAWDHYAERMTATTYGMGNRPDYSADPYAAVDPYAQQGQGYQNSQGYGQGYQNSQGYGQGYQNPQGYQSTQGYGQGYQSPQGYQNQQAEIPETKYASHPNGFGVQEEPDIDFTNL